MTKFRFVAPFIVLMLVLTACPAGSGTASEPAGGGSDTSDAPEASGGGTTGSGDTIVITSLWGGAEGAAFEEVLAGFTEATGIEATYESQRDDYATVLQTRVQGGNPPDVAIIPGIGFLRQFARAGSLIPLTDLGINREDIEGNYAEGIVDIGVVDDELYGVVVKSNSKSTVWYDPSSFEEQGFEVPTTYDDLVAITEDYAAAGATPWALGASDSWTLTDWFESIYVRQAGPEKYTQLFSGEIPWTDPSVTDAIDAMKQILNDDYVLGGIEAALGKGFVDGIGDAFADGAEAEMYYEGGFVGGIATGDVNPDLVVGETIDFFPFPTFGDSGNPVTIGGDVIAAMTDNPGVAEFMEYMTTVEAGEIWAATGFIVSPVAGVDSSVYPNEISKREAEQIGSASAVRFDGSDLLPAGMGDELGAVLQQAISGQGDLDQLLSDLEDLVSQAWEDEAA